MRDLTAEAGDRSLAPTGPGGFVIVQESRKERRKEYNEWPYNEKWPSNNSFSSNCEVDMVTLPEGQLDR